MAGDGPADASGRPLVSRWREPMRSSSEAEEQRVGFRPGGWEFGLLVTAVTLYAGLAVETILVWLADPAAANALGQQMAVELVAGREAGIPIGLSHAPRWLVFQYSLTQDLAGGFLVFPLFLLVLHRYWERDNYVMRRLRRIEARARTHRKWARKWGPLGLFAFMLVPFLVNGPLLGLVLGRIAAIHTRYLLLPVIGATAIGAFAFTFAYDYALGLAETVNEQLRTGIVVAVVAIVGTLVLIDFVREHRQVRREQQAAADAARDPPPVKPAEEE